MNCLIIGVVSYEARTFFKCRKHIVSDTTSTHIITLNYMIFSNY